MRKNNLVFIVAISLMATGFYYNIYTLTASAIAIIAFSIYCWKSTNVPYGKLIVLITSIAFIIFYIYSLREIIN